MVNVRDEVSARARARCLEEPWQTEAVVSSLLGLFTDSECGVHRSPGADLEPGRPEHKPHLPSDHSETCSELELGVLPKL